MLNGEEKFAEMRHHRFTKKATYLRCCHKSCKARLSLKVGKTRKRPFVSVTDSSKSLWGKVNIKCVIVE